MWLKFTDFGISALASFTHSMNADSPIDSSEFGKLTSVRFTHKKNAQLPILFNFSGNSILFFKSENFTKIIN